MFYLHKGLKVRERNLTFQVKFLEADPELVKAFHVLPLTA